MKPQLLFALIGLLIFPPATFAQNRDHAYEDGPVWSMSAVRVKPGRFDEYMRFITTSWKAEHEILKKSGRILDYKVLRVTDPRDNEPDIYLMIEYKNMAALDGSFDENDPAIRQVYGSVADANHGDVDRETVRTLRGEMLMREMVLK